MALSNLSKFLFLASTLTIGCVSEPVGEELEVTCDGKCDGIGSLRSLIRDAKQLDLGDLVAVGAKFATDGLNDALKVSDYASIKIDEPRFFGLPGVAEPDLTINDINELVSGLAARYGDRELSTEVNAVRRAHLMSSTDKVFAESAFKINANLNANWGESVGGFGSGDARLSVGFGLGASLEARVIGAYKNDFSGVWRAPLKALTDTRGFLFPRNIDEIKAMKPGESYALKGEGHLGANLGAGVPILVANPAGPITYSIVLSAGLRARIGGELDVQLVRLDGDEVVVDVGMQKAREWSANIALHDAWGVQGLLETNLTIGGISLDLGKLVEKALKKQLNNKLNLFSAELSRGNKTSRVSVARLRFSIDSGDKAVIGPALAQALKGDVRLAQALANRGEPGVVAEFDLLRSGSSTTGYAGVDVLGMSFFRKSIASEGSVIIQTPGGAQALLFESLHKEVGSFFSEHGYTRVGLSGLSFDANNAGEARGEANMFIQLEESDEWMERNKMLDHMDAIILALGGPTTLRNVEKAGNELERYVEATCPSQDAFDPCRVTVLNNPTVTLLRAQGADAARTGGAALSASLREVLVKAATFRMTTQATLEPKASLVGPESSITVDFRIDDGAMTQMMTERDAAAFKGMLRTYAGAVGIDRNDSETDIARDRTRIESDLKANIDELGAKFTAAQANYQRLIGVEKAVIATLGQVGPRALEIRVPVDASNRPLYEEAVAGSLAEARSQVATKLFDGLFKKVGGFATHAEEVTGYALLSMIGADRADIRLDVKMKLGNTFSQNFDHYRQAGYDSFRIYGKGDKVAPIDGGQFSIDALIQGQ